MSKRTKSLGGFEAFGPLLGLTALLMAPVWSQSSTGSVRGVVMDQGKAVIVRADVTLTNTATNIQSDADTNDVGIFVFSAVLT